MNETATCDAEISVVGGRVNNLKNVSVNIPLNKLTVITGVSGSGKTSLLLGTIHAEGQRRFLDTLSQSARHFLQRIERPDVDRIDRLPPTMATGQARPDRKSTQRVGQIDSLNELLTQIAMQEGLLYCPSCQLPLRRDDPQALFDRLQKMPEGVRLQLAIAAKAAKISKFGWKEQQRHWSESGLDRFWELTTPQQKVLRQIQLVDTPALIVVDRLTTGRIDYSRLQESLALAYRSGKGRVVLLSNEEVADNGPRLVDERKQNWRIERLSIDYACAECDFVCGRLQRSSYHPRTAEGGCESCRDARQPNPACPTCAGSGLSPLIGSIRIPGAKLAEQNELPRLQQLMKTGLQELSEFLEKRIHQQVWSSQRLSETYRELNDKLKTYLRLGLGHVCLADYVGLLSLGNWQRLQTGQALNSGLVQALFLFDEPTQGLHASDIPAMIDVIQQLIVQGNTVVIADNHPLLWSAADYVIELGPAAGTEGGVIIWSGSSDEYLRHRQQQWSEAAKAVVTASKKKYQVTESYDVSLEISENKILTLPLPLGGWTTITGRCGSGKTRLLEIIKANLFIRKERSVGSIQNEVFPFAEVIEVDDQEIKAHARSTPATLLKLLSEIRTLLAETGEAKTKGFKPVQFSFNSARGGRCVRCAGRGQIELETHFLPGQTVRCPECVGTRFDAETRKITYRSRNIAEVLAMSAEEAFGFFRNVPGLQKKLQSLRDVGLGYLPLGLPITQLSTGELKRLKLASLLLTSPGQRYLFLFDEPSQGLHEVDVLRIRDCFLRLLEQGHTVICADVHPLLIESAAVIVECGDNTQEWTDHLPALLPATELLQQDDSTSAQVVKQWRKWFPNG